ncbi:MAG: hypothetical protein ACREDR_02895 [Blastocatellia bacterium]
MRHSSYVANVPFPCSDFHFLFHPIRGSVDIVSTEIGTLFGSIEESFTDLQPSELDALAKRGYLTDAPPDQERDQGVQILEALARRNHPALEITVVVPDLTNLVRTGLSDVRESLLQLFGLASLLARDQVLPRVRPEIRSSRVSFELVKLILETAIDFSLPVHPEITIAGLDALAQNAGRANFDDLDIVSDFESTPDGDADIEAAISTLTEFLERQVQIMWTADTSKMSLPQLEFTRRIGRALQGKYQNLMMVVLSDMCGAVSAIAPAQFNQDLEKRLYPINAENADLLKTLHAFISKPHRINYKPVFALQPDSLTLDLGRHTATYESRGRGVTLSGLDKIKTFAESVPPVSGSPDAAMTPEEWSECRSCKYAFICGRNWLRSYHYQKQHECANALDKRIEQVLPLLFSNLGKFRSIVES